MVDLVDGEGSFVVGGGGPVEEELFEGGTKEIQNAINRLPDGGVLTLSYDVKLRSQVLVTRPITVRGGNGGGRITVECTSDVGAFLIR